MIDHLAKLAVFVATVVGLVTIARWVEGAVHPPPRPGWICVTVTRTTSTESKNGTRCDPVEGWHIEEWPEIGQVAVPDRAVRRRSSTTRASDTLLDGR
jgi:hypothetical protein